MNLDLEKICREEFLSLELPFFSCSHESGLVGFNEDQKEVEIKCKIAGFCDGKLETLIEQEFTEEQIKEAFVEYINSDQYFYERGAINFLKDAILPQLEECEDLQEIIKSLGNNDSEVIKLIPLAINELIGEDDKVPNQVLAQTLIKQCDKLIAKNSCEKEFGELFSNSKITAILKSGANHKNNFSSFLHPLDSVYLELALRIRSMHDEEFKRFLNCYKLLFP